MNSEVVLLRIGIVSILRRFSIAFSSLLCLLCSLKQYAANWIVARLTHDTDPETRDIGPL